MAEVKIIVRGVGVDVNATSSNTVVEQVPKPPKPPGSK